MTDNSQVVKAGSGATKAGLIGIYMLVCQHATPPLAGYLNMQFPFFGTDASFEIVVFVQSLIAGAISKWTPNYVVDNIVDMILWCKQSFRKIRSAANNGE